MPVAGAAGQVLQKNSAADFDTIWVTPVPGGVTSFNARTGPITLATADVTGALGYSDIARAGMANVFTTGPQTIQTGLGANVGMILKGSTSQAGNLLECRDVNNVLFVNVTNVGVLSCGRGIQIASGFTLSSLGALFLDSAAATSVRLRPAATEVLTLQSTASPTIQVTNPLAASKALVVKAALNQTGNLLELQDSTAATLVKFTAGGFLQEPRGPFNVRAYGAKGDGVANDTTAFQQAFDAAVAVNGEVLIPPPEATGAYMLSAPVVIQPGGSTGNGSGQCRIRVKGMGNYQYIQWTGPNNSSVFVLHGVKDSLFDGLNIQLATTSSGVIVWDCQPTAAAGSMSNVRWSRCRVVFGTGGHNIAWRTGQSAPTGGTSDHANFFWDHCQVSGSGNTLGDIAFQIGGNQSIPQLFLDCSVASVWQVYQGGAIACLSTASIAIGDTTLTVDDTTGFPASGTLQVGGATEQITYTGKTATTFTGCTRGANGTTAQAYSGGGYVVNQFVTNVPGGVASVGVYQGAEAMTWVGGGGSACSGDFLFCGGGRYDIIGYRGESGNKFLRASCGTTSAYQAITFKGCELATYAPPDGVCFLLKSNTHLRLTNCNITGNATPFTAAFITEAGSGANGCIEVTNSAITATDPFYTLSAGNQSLWPVVVERVAAVNGAGSLTGFFASPARRRTVQTLPYSASITPNPQAGEYLTLSVTDGNPFTINAPTVHPAGSRITLEITNNFTGSLGTVTWAAGYNLASAWISPAAGATVTISFVYNGTKWVETASTAPQGGAVGATVTSFNTRTGDITLTTADVGAALPTNVAKTDATNVFTVGPQTIQTATTTSVGLVVKGVLNQTGNLQEWRDSTNTLLCSFSYQGQLISNRGITCGNGYTYASAGTLYFDSAAGTGVRFRPATTEVLTLFSSTSPTVQITNPLAASKAFIIKAALNQTGSLQECQDSTGATLCKIDGKGLIYPVQAPTASAPAYVKGALYFDTTLNKLRVGGATAWETLTSS